ncbi:MAG TPA: HEAT repeat domain-containing protein [Actinotalea sp.]
MGVRGEHRQELMRRAVTEWDAYLTEHSGLPGPRGNLELLAAVGDVAPAAYLWACAASSDEYLAACGAAGLGRLLAEGDQEAEPALRRLAADGRWRVREGVAMALQRLGDVDLARLVEITTSWAADGPLVQRAAAAGLCEPRLLRSPTGAQAAIDLMDRLTGALAALPAQRRRDDDVRVLRQALGYCWSVAVAAAPAAGFPLLERWAAADDPDVAWVVRENLRKTRLARADPGWTARIAAAVPGVRPAPPRA